MLAVSGEIIANTVLASVAVLGVLITLFGVIYKLGGQSAVLLELVRKVDRIENGSLDKDYRTDVDRRLGNLEQTVFSVPQRRRTDQT